MGFTISKRFADAATSKSGKGGAYLNPSKLADGGSVKFHIVSDEPLEFWEVGAKALTVSSSLSVSLRIRLPKTSRQSWAISAAA